VSPAAIVGVVCVTVVSITSHEAAHGFVANRLGDPTARDQGRLTLNPLRHIDLFFTILLPLFLILSHSGMIFGGAKPVPVDVRRLGRPRRDWALVGIAGPATNIAMAMVLAAVLWLATRAGVAGPSSTVTEILAIGIYLNALLAVFNLVPIPPLDGSRVVQYFLSGESLVLYRRVEQYGLVIIVGLMVFVPRFQVLLARAIFGLVALLTAPFGLTAEIEPLLRSLLFR
jgi:Zn-dependent protease